MARPLSEPITTEEIQSSSAKLNNRRATGEDQIPGELLKYGGHQLHELLARLFNFVFTSHTHMDSVGEGVLIPLNKPGKTPVVTNTRPITLLNTKRKVLSNILLDREYHSISQFVSLEQSGFRRGRSTSDIIWTYRWLIATVQRYDEKFHIMGIDMSKAFDCLDRKFILHTVNDFKLFSESSFRILVYLMSHTSLKARINKTYGNKFSTTIGTPQGDSLSPILFILYLEATMRKFRALHPRPTAGFYMEPKYADDVDFIDHQQDFNNIITDAMIGDTLAQYNLKKNNDKTEYITISKATCKQLNIRKLGSKISDGADIKYRIAQASIAFNAMWKIWLQNRTIKLKTRIRLYNACVKSILMYNLAALGATATQTKILDTAHRRHLRRILRIYYPKHISNNNLYKITDSRPITTDIVKHRWRLFGHILRSHPDTPANKTMTQYFETRSRTTGENRKRHRGREATSIAVVLRNDLALVGRKFHAAADLTSLKNIAHRRKEWTTLWCRIARVRASEETKKIEKRQEKRRQRMIEIAIPDQDNGHRQRRLRLLPPEEPLTLTIRRTARRPRPAAEEAQTRQEALRPRHQNEEQQDIHNRRMF
eukprot:gene22573-28706_t